MTLIMGLRCFLVLMCIVIHSSIALECHNVFNYEQATCDECIRCGGVWCKDPYETKHCKRSAIAGDDWCLEHREFVHVEPKSQDGLMFSPLYEENLAEINSDKVTEVQIIGNPQAVKGSRVLQPYKILNATQPAVDRVDVQIDLINSGSAIKVTTRVKQGFCSPTAQKFEYVWVEIGLKGVTESATLKYHVQCGCACSAEVVAQAPACHDHGNLTCGSCQCDDNWKGQFCQICPDRGDTSQSCLKQDEIQCSGNGFCDMCNKCQCFTDGPGSQYFEPENECKGICNTINETECLTECLQRNNEGYCNETCDQHFYGKIQHYNESLLEDRDYSNRTIWVKCSVYFGQKQVIYWAAKYETSMTMTTTEIHMMRKDVGESGALVPASAGNGVTVPVVGTLVALLVAAVAASVVYVMWKGQGALPTAGSNYANIDPEDSVGVNPLYKPPTSSFKNPMYAAKS